MTTYTFTVFCRESNDTGTTYITAVHIDKDDVDVAKEVGRADCHEAWGGSIDDITVIGVAKGDVNIVFWEDIE